MDITEKEILFLEEQLSLEKLMEQKCLDYAPLCDDPQLKMKLESLAGRHSVIREQLLSTISQELEKAECK